jgi:hypothetical protein
MSARLFIPTLRNRIAFGPAAGTWSCAPIPSPVPQRIAEPDFALSIEDRDIGYRFLAQGRIVFSNF